MRKIYYLSRGFVISLLLLSGCATLPPPRNVDNLCSIFKQYPKWYYSSLRAQSVWKVPVTVQMAIMHQESKFDATAVPPRTKLLWIIPWNRPSTAYGYSQALDGTWALYKQSRGGFLASRENFADSVDFIGWYSNQAYRKAGISLSNPYALYLAYHEGVGGYMRKTYLHKPWLIYVAHKVSRREKAYRIQLASCKGLV